MELLISVAVLSIGIAVAATAFTSAQQFSARFGNVNRALSISEGFMEEASMKYSSSSFFAVGTQTVHYDKLGNRSASPAMFRLDFEVSPSAVPGLAKIDIRVSWTEAGGFPRDISFISYRTVQ